MLRRVLILDERLGDEVFVDARAADRLIAEILNLSRIPPVLFQALRGDADPGGAAERDAFGQPCVVAVQQGGGVGGQQVDLDHVSGLAHQESPLVWR